MNSHKLLYFPIHSLQIIFSLAYYFSTIYLRSETAYVFAAIILFLSLSLDCKTSLNLLKYSLLKRSFISLSITLCGWSILRYLYPSFSTCLITPPFSNSIIIFIIFIMLNSSQLKALDLKYFGIITVNTATNQLPRNPQFFEPGY